MLWDEPKIFFLERRYFFSIILSEFLKNRVALQLENEGASVTEAWNGKEAVELFARSAPGHFDVILMDVMMPEMDGLEATRRIRAMDRPDARTVPIIAMTANAFSDDIQRSREAGVNEHLSKPLDLPLLLQAIHRCLHQ